MNPTKELLRLIGSPFARSATYRLDQHKLAELCRNSTKNRMLLLYLETIMKNNLGDFSTIYQEEYLRYLKANDAIVRASRTLADASVNYAVFKSIRPYRSATVDIDILIFEDKGNYMKSVETMRKAGYKLVGHGPRSTTLWDKEADLRIDLYEQIAVSFITYIDKQKLTAYITSIKMPNGEYVKALRPEADLACIIAHSIIKEQMYTLSEYYTFLQFLPQMDTQRFVQLARQNNISSAVRTHSTITALLHKAAHNTVPKEIRQIMDSIGEDNFEKTQLIKNKFITPHKYHPITIARSLLEITKGKETIKSIGNQLIHMIDPTISNDFSRKFIEHIFRETY